MSEKARGFADFNSDGLAKKQALPAAGPVFTSGITIISCQRPKNSHNRIITGIGTPSSQSKMPRPMVLSSNFFNQRKNAKGRVRFRRQEQKTVSSRSGV
jgi:hypothetical protein